MSKVQVDLPDDLRAAVAERTARGGVSEAEWLVEAVRAKLAADLQIDYLTARASRGDRTAYDAVLAGVPEAPPSPGDER